MKVMCIDLKSFYASVECVLRGLDPFTTNLVVADASRGHGSICLAASPALKRHGVKSRGRIYDLPQGLDIIFAKPRMKKYIEYASKIYEVYLKYVDRSDIHVYSIDEAFLDFTSYQKFYNLSMEDIAKKILEDIYNETKVSAACGIGDNMFLAKVALDCLAKHSENRIFYLNEDLFKNHMWDYKPLGDIWGIGRQIEKRLAKMNIFTLGDLANYSLEKLEKEFGIIGKELYEHAYGIDRSVVSEVRNYKPQAKSFGHGQVMFEDYNYKDMYTILIEYVDELATELIMKKQTCQLIGLGIGYSKDVHGGFSRQLTLPNPTNSKKVLLEGFKQLYFNNIQDLPIRRIDVRVGKLNYEDFVQTDIFNNATLQQKEHDLYEAIGEIKDKFGRSSINMAISYTEKATKIKRNALVGGHNAE